jgi:catechol 2,3-dioxygenase-like lactoylglutathione lyase family enzyme
VIRFDHVNIRVSDQEAARDFLIAVLGVAAGPRPPFDFHGYWLCLGDLPVIHLMGERGRGIGGPGWVDHVAFGPFDFEAKRAELSAAGHTFRTSVMPGTGLKQIFVEGPEGIRVELQCPEGG